MAMKCPASRNSYKVTPHYSRVQPLGTRTFGCTANGRMALAANPVVQGLAPSYHRGHFSFDAARKVGHATRSCTSMSASEPEYRSLQLV